MGDFLKPFLCYLKLSCALPPPPELQLEGCGQLPAVYFSAALGHGEWRGQHAAWLGDQGPVLFWDPVKCPVAVRMPPRWVCVPLRWACPQPSTLIWKASSPGCPSSLPHGPAGVGGGGFRSQAFSCDFSPAAFSFAQHSLSKQGWASSWMLPDLAISPVLHTASWEGSMRLWCTWHHVRTFCSFLPLFLLFQCSWHKVEPLSLLVVVDF